MDEVFDSYKVKAKYLDQNSKFGMNISVVSSENMNDLTKSSMEKTFDDFATAIARNDVMELTSILDNSDLKDVLLNGEIQTKYEVSKESHGIVREVSATRAVHIAILEQSFECFALLLDYGSNFFPDSTNSNNVLHYLVYSNTITRNDITLSKMYEKILQNCDLFQRREMLLHRNKDSQTALELAVKFSCSKLFHLFLYTEGVNRRIDNKCGKTITNIFVFPKHETTEGKSFIWQLANIKDTSNASEVAEILRHDIIQTYIRKKFQKVAPIGIFWFAFRLFPFILSFLVEFEEWNRYYRNVCQVSNKVKIEEFLNQEQSASTDTIYEIGMPLFGSIVIIFDIIEFTYLYHCRKESMSESFYTHYNRTVNTTFYRINTLILGLMVIPIGLFELFDAENGHPIEHTLSTFYLLNLLFNTISVMYFIQLLPLIGYFVIGFQRMLTAVFRFCILQVAVLLLFTVLFTYVRVYSCEASVKLCQRHLNLYDTLLMMLNMVSDVIPSDSQCDAWGSFALRVLHGTYVFVVAITIINYLIAVMSSAYNDFTILHDTVQTLHKLHFALVIERRIGMFRRLIPTKWQKSSDQEDVLMITEVCRDFESIHTLRLPRDSYSNGFEKINSISRLQV